MNICIIGAGAYGSYIINVLLKQHPSSKITLVEVGNSNIRSEKEMGYLSFIKKRIYNGLRNGRYFGFGGTTEKWGGQLLTFSSSDFKNPDPFMSEIIRLNEKHKETVLSRFKLNDNTSDKFVTDRLFIKTGIWLSVFKRNFFKYFNIFKSKQLVIISNARVSKILKEGKVIKQIIYVKDGKDCILTSDYYFLTPGAFESARILLSSGFNSFDKVYFSDHISQKVFKIKKTTQIGNDDFVFKLNKFSLVTKRLIGEYKNNSFYIHPVFNMDFPIFKSLKSLLFSKKISLSIIKDVLLNIPQAFEFFWSILYHKKIYVYKSEWFLYIDIDNPTSDSYVELSIQKDKYGINGLNVNYDIGKEASTIFNYAKNQVLDYLISNNIEFEILTNEIDIDNIEDIYHPHKMFNYNDLPSYFSEYDNMLMINTGILSRSGGINPTAALFPVIEEFIQYHLKSKFESFN